MVNSLHLIGLYLERVAEKNVIITHDEDTFPVFNNAIVEVRASGAL